MNKYGMYLQNGDDLIHLTHQENIERAIEFFANIKKMPIKNFNKIFIVKKEDFYEFINKGNNILRSCEDAGMNNGKKYLIYLIKHNIM